MDRDQKLLDEDDIQFTTRQLWLSDNQALRLASKHNLATTVYHEMTTSDKVCVIPYFSIIEFHFNMQYLQSLYYT